MCTVKVVPTITSNSGNCKYKLKVVETVKSHNYCNQSEITVINVIQLFLGGCQNSAFLLMSVDNSFPIRQQKLWQSEVLKVLDTVTAFSPLKVNCTPRLRGCEISLFPSGKKKCKCPAQIA